MTTNNEDTSLKFEEIWKNLVITDKEENLFQFSSCRNRHIVVLGSETTPNYLIGDIIRRDTYKYPYYPLRKEEQNTITYVMAPGDTLCNVCIVNLIDIPSLEYFIKRTEKTRKDLTPSPMIAVDKTIYKFATKIDLIVLVCEGNNFELMKNMKKWALDREDVMALALIVHPTVNTKAREDFIRAIRANKEFIDNGLNTFFRKGIFCVSDLSYSSFKNQDEQVAAQLLVKDWRSKFLQACIGGKNERKFEIIVHDDKQSKNSSYCATS